MRPWATPAFAAMCTTPDNPIYPANPNRRQHVDEAPFEVQGDSRGYGAPAAGRRRVAASMPTILCRFTVVVVPNSGLKISDADAIALATRAGATVVTATAAAGLKLPQESPAIVYIAALIDEGGRAAQLAMQPARAAGVRTTAVDLLWLFDSISRHAAQPFDQYRGPARLEGGKARAS